MSEGNWYHTILFLIVTLLGIFNVASTTPLCSSRWWCRDRCGVIDLLRTYHGTISVHNVICSAPITVASWATLHHRTIMNERKGVARCLDILDIWYTHVGIMQQGDSAITSYPAASQCHNLVAQQLIVLTLMWYPLPLSCRCHPHCRPHCLLNN